MLHQLRHVEPDGRGIARAADQREESARYDFTNEGGVGGRIRLLKNITGLWLVQECRRYFKAQGQDLDYAELEKLCGQARRWCRSSIRIMRRFAPGDIPKKIERSAATGQRPPTSPGAFVRVCLESLAMTYRRTLATLEDLLGKKIKTIHVVGGGSQNSLLNQMTADALRAASGGWPGRSDRDRQCTRAEHGDGQRQVARTRRKIVLNSFEPRRFEPRDTKTWDAALTDTRNSAAPLMILDCHVHISAMTPSRGIMSRQAARQLRVQVHARRFGLVGEDESTEAGARATAVRYDR